jgi:hypothetical protein
MASSARKRRPGWMTDRTNDVDSLVCVSTNENATRRLQIDEGRTNSPGRSRLLARKVGVVRNDRAALIASSLMIFVGISACGSGSGNAPAHPAAEPTLGAVVKITDPRQAVRPVNAYLPGAAEILQLENARYVAMNHCLSSKGVAGRFETPQAMSAFVAGQVKDRSVRSDLYGFFDVENASAHGYHRPASTPDVVFEMAPTGVPAAVVKECQAMGARALGGVESVTGPWSTCGAIA